MNLDDAIKQFHNRDHAIRSQAFAVIEQAGEQALPVLIASLSENDDYRQEIAIGLLWHMLREQELSHPDEAKAVMYAIQANRDNNLLVVRDGLGLLYDLADPVVFDDLLECLREEDDGMREGAAEVLGVLGDERAVIYLLPLLTDPEWHVRVAAVFALGNIGSETALPELILKLSDQETMPVIIKEADGTFRRGLLVAEAAFSALQSIGNDEALAAIKKWKDDQRI